MAGMSGSKRTARHSGQVLLGIVPVVSDEVSHAAMQEEPIVWPHLVDELVSCFSDHKDRGFTANRSSMEL